ncbi:MAG: MFS transporter [Planctomycetaceae bacterium]|nr:MFS transporter [Planctomycetaceae bacterium]
MSLHRVTRAVIASQLLFSAGHVLTTGGFLYYYADAFGPSAFQFSFLLILPELAESVGFLARPISRRVGSRKRTWMASLLVGRLFALGVPLMAAPVLTSGDAWPFEVLVIWVAGWYVFQGIAFACLISWLSDLVPEGRWGRLFAGREVAILAIKLSVPVLVGIVRRRWADALPDEQKLVTYVTVFLIGNAVVAASLLPLRRLPESRREPNNASELPSQAAPTWTMLLRALRDRNIRWILLHSWWLSFAQGLTQSAFFKYQTSVLHLSVETYYVLNGLMLGLQAPLALWGGRLSDQGRDKQVLFWSVTAVSGAMLFWLAATPDRWWLLSGAFVVWGLFGFVNVSGRNLMLRLSPRGDNIIQISLFRQIGGLCAALAGLLGGLWLDALLATAAASQAPSGAGASPSLTSPLEPFRVLFLVSFVGRLTAGLWVLPIRAPVIEDVTSAPTDPA